MRDQRRVLVLNHFAKPRNSPGGTRHIDLFSLLDAWEATILASNRNSLSKEIYDLGDDRFRLVWTTPYDGEGHARALHWFSYAVTAFTRALRESPPDVIYASTPHLLAGLTGQILARVYRVPLVLEVRDIWPKVLVDMGRLDEQVPLYWILRLIERSLYTRADRIVVLAEGTRGYLGAEGVDLEKTVFIPNVSTISLNEVTAESGREFRIRQGLDGFVVAYTGAHGPANGLHYVLEAAHELRHSHPDITFCLVGDGTQKPELMAEARSASLDNVRFLPPVPKHDLPAVFAAADCGLHVLADVPLFRYAVSPNKLVDYMAAGLPVITNTPGEVAQLVVKAAAGVAVAPTEIAKGVAAVRSASDARRRAWGRAGQAYVQRHRSPRALAQTLEETLDGL